MARKKPYYITQDKINSLDEIGFKWKIRNASARPISTTTSVLPSNMNLIPSTNDSGSAAHQDDDDGGGKMSASAEVATEDNMEAEAPAVPGETNADSTTAATITGIDTITMNTSTDATDAIDEEHLSSTESTTMPPVTVTHDTTEMQAARIMIDLCGGPSSSQGTIHAAATVHPQINTIASASNVMASSDPISTPSQNGPKSNNTMNTSTDATNEEEEYDVKDGDAMDVEVIVPSTSPQLHFDPDFKRLGYKVMNTVHLTIEDMNEFVTTFFSHASREKVSYEEVVKENQLFNHNADNLSDSLRFEILVNDEHTTRPNVWIQRNFCSQRYEKIRRGLLSEIHNALKNIGESKNIHIKDESFIGRKLKCERQFAHIDDDVAGDSYGVLIPLRPQCKWDYTYTLHVNKGSHAKDIEEDIEDWEEVTIKQGQLIVFDMNLMHAGAGAIEENMFRKCYPKSQDDPSKDFTHLSLHAYAYTSLEQMNQGQGKKNTILCPEVE